MARHVVGQVTRPSALSKRPSSAIIRLGGLTALSDASHLEIQGKPPTIESSSLSLTLESPEVLSLYLKRSPKPHGGTPWLPETLETFRQQMWRWLRLELSVGWMLAWSSGSSATIRPPAESMNLRIGPSRGQMVDGSVAHRNAYDVETISPPISRGPSTCISPMYVLSLGNTLALCSIHFREPPQANLLDPSSTAKQELTVRAKNRGFMELL
ncbi:hypothetical protein LZ30DRAFT_687469 [Colletotrichum cereale]|nr:hypothetical protein LZ30DRAFT_687469 [Colletotrichum cereale]